MHRPERLRAGSAFRAFRAAWCAAATVFGLAACGGSEAADDGSAPSSGRTARTRPDTFVAGTGGIAAGSVTRDGAHPGAVRVLGAADADCPLTGAWRPCSVEDRLVRAGLAPQRADSAPALVGEAREAWRYWLGDAEVQVFLYTDRDARVAAEQTVGATIGEPPILDAARGSARTTVASGNLLAVVHGPRARQVERITLTLSGALPEP